MPELLSHLIGDYILQNHWMALNKTRSSRACLAHVALYTLPFLAVTRSPAALAIIAGTHFAIDRWSLAKRWPAFWGVGCEGWVGARMRAAKERRFVARIAGLDGWTSEKVATAREVWREQNPPMPPAPPFLAVWLTIIADNTAHLAINHAALSWL